MNKDYVGYYNAVCDAVIQDHELRKLMESSCGALSLASYREDFTLVYQIQVLGSCLHSPWMWSCVWERASRAYRFTSGSREYSPRLPVHSSSTRHTQWLRGHIQKDKFPKNSNLNRRIWRSVVTSYIEQMAKMQSKDEFTARKREDLHARRAACVKLAAAFDGFAAWELCMHIFLGAGHDEAVLGAILPELDGDEVIAVLGYLNKWLEKYDSRLAHKGQMNRDERKLMPSAHFVIRWIGALLEGRYASIVLGKGVNDEIETIQRLMAGGRKIGSLEGVLQHLLTESPLPSEKLGVSEHIIEYLEIS